MTIDEKLEKNEKAIQGAENSLAGIREVYPRRYALHSEAQDKLLDLYKQRCKLLAELAGDK